MKTGLVILDGWGIGRQDDSNAIYKAHTPVMDALLKSYPNATLRTDGENVGLPEGQMGNSEVGHMNIGAGRIVYQDLLRIHRAVDDGSFQENPVLLEAMKDAKKSGGRLHLMGLIGDGGVHAHQKHLKALVDLAYAQGIDHTFIHAFTDGRDTDPHSGEGFMEDLLTHLEGKPAEVVSIIGRYFAMDRDKRWERIAKAYDLLTAGKGKSFKDALEALKSSYADGVTDEFIEPSVIGSDPEASRIQAGDTVICFNFRTDRCREITMALTQKDYPDYGMKVIPLHYFTMTRYDESFKGVEVIFDKDNLRKTLGEVLAGSERSQLRIAETEKYPHVTFFFSGGEEEAFDGEGRIVVPSPKVATYDLQPEMSIHEVTSQLKEYVTKEKPEFVCLNFANPDMVGHTGDFQAIIKAVEATDSCLGEWLEFGLEKGYSFVIIADHGNAEYAVNEDGSPNTAHTTNPVPVIVVDRRVSKVQDGILADVAPTILKLMGVPKPKEMTGKSLVSLTS